MQSINRVVHLHTEHINVPKEDDQMEQPPKEFKFGNSTVIIHSPLAHMTQEEQKQWFDEEWKKGNSVLKTIAATLFEQRQSS